MLFAFFDPCLSHRDADAKLKDEQTSLALFDDHMAAAHGSHVSVIDTVTIIKEISRISVVNKYSKAPDSSEARESCCRQSSFQQPKVLKSSLGRNANTVHIPN